MSETVVQIGAQSKRTHGIATAAVWIAQIAVAGILGMGAFTKFFMFTPDGSMALSEALGVGRGIILGIAVVEATAATLILISRRHLIGGLLAGATMGGALFSHATRIGWSGNPAAEMWPLALIGFVAASWVVKTYLPQLLRASRATASRSVWKLAESRGRRHVAVQASRVDRRSGRSLGAAVRERFRRGARP
jgi:hypothetical protein